jgi:hypothetical protein
LIIFKGREKGKKVGKTDDQGPGRTSEELALESLFNRCQKDLFSEFDACAIRDWSTARDGMITAQQRYA